MLQPLRVLRLPSLKLETTAALRRSALTVSTQYSAMKVLRKCEQLNLDYRNVPDLSDLWIC